LPFSIPLHFNSFAILLAILFLTWFFLCYLRLSIPCPPPLF
jgi:hypothetical protein